MDITFRTIGLSTATIFVFGTGILLTRSGYPFNNLLLAAHKLVALAVVVIVGVLIRRAVPISASDWKFVVVATLLCIVAFVSGGLISALESGPAWVIWSHRIGVWLIALILLLFIGRVV